MQSDLQAAVTRSVLYNEAQHRKTHPAHGWVLLRQVHASIGNVLDRYPDDPALAGALLAERMPSIQGLISDILQWGRAVDAADPADLPQKGAICRDS